MMDDINAIYYNNVGIAFQWKRCAAQDIKKTQLVFRDISLFLTDHELQEFSKRIDSLFTQTSLCNDCKVNKNVKSLLVNSPAPQISFVMSYHELTQVKDLIDGTLFQLNLDTMLTNIL